MALADMRQEYEQPPLNEADMAATPLEQFRRWFDDARQAKIIEPNAMTVATCDAQGQVSARVMLLKEADEQGFVFYSNYLSEKAAALHDNPRAELVFFWDVLQRSVRVQGDVTRVSRDEAAAYFRSRPRASQIGAWASQQSRVLGTRQELDEAFVRYEQAYEGRDVPLPDFWGGYRVWPQRVEFWQGQRSRLHDRVRYVRSRGGGWLLQRVSP